MTKGLIAACLIISFPSFNTVAQSNPINEYQLKAAFIYNFTRFINWPPDSFFNPEDPFVIGVLGNERLSAYLNLLVKGEKLNDRAIIVRSYKNIKDVEACHILFIADEWASKIKNKIPVINHQSTLTVSDAPNFAEMGGIIGFYKEKNKLRLEVNINEAKSSELVFSSKLLSVSNIYSTN
jgi:uncharacterized protein YlbG (UPF0298 family)